MVFSRYNYPERSLNITVIMSLFDRPSRFLFCCNYVSVMYCFYDMSHLGVEEALRLIDINGYYLILHIF